MTTRFKTNIQQLTSAIAVAVMIIAIISCFVADFGFGMTWAPYTIMPVMITVCMIIILIFGFPPEHYDWIFRKYAVIIGIMKAVRTWIWSDRLYFMTAGLYVAISIMMNPWFLLVVLAFLAIPYIPRRETVMNTFKNFGYYVCVIFLIWGIIIM